MSVLTLQAAKTHLNIASTANDVELQGMIYAAESAIARKVGPLEPTTVTERVPGGSALALRTSPAISLTSVTTVTGTALTLTDLYLDTEAGVVSNNWGESFHAVAYDVVYQAGRTTCPDDILLALKELVRHLWDSQRGGARRPGAQQSDALANTLPGSAYTFPIRVSELLAPHVRLGFA